MRKKRTNSTGPRLEANSTIGYNKLFI